MSEPLTNGDRQVFRDERGRLLPGSVLSPGRPQGSRHKIEEAFLADLHTAWVENGPSVIARMIDEKPNEFVRVVATVLPKESRDVTDPLDDLTEEQLADRIRDIYARIVALVGTGPRLGGNGAEAGAEQTLSLSTLQ